MTTPCAESSWKPPFHGLGPRRAISDVQLWKSRNPHPRSGSLPRFSPAADGSPGLLAYQVPPGFSRRRIRPGADLSSFTASFRGPPDAAPAPTPSSHLASCGRRHGRGGRFSRKFPCRCISPLETLSCCSMRSDCGMRLPRNHRVHIMRPPHPGTSPDDTHPQDLAMWAGFVPAPIRATYIK